MCAGNGCDWLDEDAFWIHLAKQLQEKRRLAVAHGGVANSAYRHAKSGQIQRDLVIEYASSAVRERNQSSQGLANHSSEARGSTCARWSRSAAPRRVF